MILFIETLYTDLLLKFLAGTTMKSIGIFAVAVVVTYSLRHKSAAIRGLIWGLAILGCIIVPLFSFTLPKWEVNVLTKTPSRFETHQFPDNSQSPAFVVSTEPSYLLSQVGSSTQTTSTPTQSKLGSNADRIPFVMSWADWIGVIWAGGGLFFLVRLIAGIGAVWHISTRSEDFSRVVKPKLRDWNPRISVRLSDRIAVPMMWGVLRPVILLPVDAGSWPAARLRTALLHELAHVKRWDWTMQAIAQLTCAVYWFNPLVWFASHQMRIAAEQACDDHVLNAGYQSTDYAQHLLNIAQNVNIAGSVSRTAVAMARPSQIENRLRTILTPNLNRHPVTKVSVVIGLCSLICFAVPMSAMRLVEAFDLKAPFARLGKGGMTDIKFSHDGTRLVVSGHTGVWVYDAHTGDEAFQLVETNDTVRTIAFSPDGSKIASGGLGPDIRLWELGTGGHLTIPSSQTHGFTAFDFSPDGSMLASGGKKGTLKLWETATGQELADFTVGQASIEVLVFSPDGRTLASCSGDRISLWDIATNTRRATFKGHKAKISALVFSPDGQLLASGGHSEIRLWDVAAQRERLTFSRHTNTVRALAFLMDNKTLASADKDGAIRLWDTATGDLRATVTKLIGNPEVFAFSPNGATIAAGNWAGNLEVREVPTGREVFSRLTAHIGVISTMAFTPDGRTIVSGGHDGVFRMWDVAADTMQLANQVGQPTAEWRLVISADGSTIAAGMPADQEASIQIWDTESGSSIASVKPKHTGFDSVFVISPDGARLASGGRDGSIFVVDTKTGRDLMRLTEHTDTINALVFSPDGNRLASSGRDGKILVWDVGSKDLLLTLTDECGYLAFSPDGKTLASVGRGIRLWDIETGGLTTLTTYEGIGVRALVFSPDSETLVTGGFDLRAWNVKAGSRIIDHSPYVAANNLRLIQTLAFSPDGKTIAVGDWEGILLWNWDKVAFWGAPFDR